MWEVTTIQGTIIQRYKIKYINICVKLTRKVSKFGRLARIIFSCLKTNTFLTRGFSDGILLMLSFWTRYIYTIPIILVLNLALYNHIKDNSRPINYARNTIRLSSQKCCCHWLRMRISNWLLSLCTLETHWTKWNLNFAVWLCLWETVLLSSVSE